MMNRMIVFDDRDFSHPDGQTPDLSPITDLRATFEIRTGMLTNLQRLNREWNGQLSAVWVPQYLQATVTDRIKNVPVNQMPLPQNNDSNDFNDPASLLFLVNGRWSYPAAKFEIDPGQALVEQNTGSVIAALLNHSQAEQFLTQGLLPSDIEQIGYPGQLLIKYVWEILAGLPEILITDLLSFIANTETNLVPNPSDNNNNDDFGYPIIKHLQQSGVTIIGDEPVYLDPTAKVYPTVVLDAESGPIVIDSNAVIRPGVIISGPAYIGCNSQILDHALIKANTAIGPVCKVAGEVGGTIFQGYANKAHDGHLGDSFIGEWVNIGAGTTNSNLLNTYGEITMQTHPHKHRHKTSMMYLGSIIGDHVKLAINTRLMTGTVIGTGSMIALSHPPHACIGAFDWITDTVHHMYRWDKFLEVAKIVMHRRNIKLTAVYQQRLHDLHNEVSANDT